MSDWPGTWKAVDRLLRRSETLVVFPMCFRCGTLIAHEDLVEGLTVILFSRRHSHRKGILINCPACGRDIAVFDPLFREEVCV